MKKKSKLITNSPTAVAERFTEVTLIFTANKSLTRYDTLEGKEHLVVPCVMITEGVHNGSMGPLYYPAKEIAKSAPAWNSKPVVVNHPTINGLPISACAPDVFNTRKIGVLMNTRWEDGKLKTECWIDVEKSNKVDDRVLQAVENGEMMEVSTGLFMDDEKVEGEWNGEKYETIVRNYRPDHLAILPDHKGACSIEDGAGLLRNKADLQGAEKKLADHLALRFNELSHNEIWRMLNDKIQTSAGNDAWAIDVFDKFFTYDLGEKVYYQEYEIEDDEVKLIGLRKEAKKIIQYVLADGVVVGNKDEVVGNGFCSNKKEIVMKNKKKVVDALIANEKAPWTEDEREILMNMSDEKVEAWVTNAEEKEEPIVPPVEPKTEKLEAPKAKDVPAPTENKEVTDESYIANAPKGVQEMYHYGMATLQKEKAELIQKITANERNPFMKEQLESKEVGELKQLAVLAEMPQPASIQRGPNFVGMGEFMANVDPNAKEEALQAPSMDFSKAE